MYIWKPIKNNYLFEFQAWPEKELPIVKVYTQEVASLENIIVGEHGRKNSRSSSKKCLPSLGSWWSDLSTSRTPILLRLFYDSQFLPINFHNSGHIFKPPFYYCLRTSFSHCGWRWLVYSYENSIKLYTPSTQ